MTDTKVVHLGLSPRAAEVLRTAVAYERYERVTAPEELAILRAICDELDDQLAGGRHPSRPADATFADLVAARMAEAAASALKAAAA
jgi:hypothetical protein